MATKLDKRFGLETEPTVDVVSGRAVGTTLAEVTTASHGRTTKQVSNVFIDSSFSTKKGGSQSRVTGAITLTRAVTTEGLRSEATTTVKASLRATGGDGAMAIGSFKRDKQG